MANTFDAGKFRKLLLLSIGSRTQKEFAEQAGLSGPNISRLLNSDGSKVPAVTTLWKIADNSEGRVTMDMLREACGYGISKQEYSSIPEKVKYEAESLMEGIRQFSGTPIRYSSIEDMLDSVDMIYSEAPTKYEIGEEMDYNGKGHRSAERFVNITARWGDDDVSVRFAFALFFCKTEKGGYIITDAAFDLHTLYTLEHEYALAALMRLSEKENANMADYPMLYGFNYKNKEAEERDKTAAARRLLRAIFGDDLTKEEEDRMLRKAQEKKKEKEKEEAKES